MFAIVEEKTKTEVTDECQITLDKHLNSFFVT